MNIHDINSNFPRIWDNNSSRLIGQFVYPSAPSIPAPTDYIAYYNMDFGVSGTKILDNSGSGHVATVQNGTLNFASGHKVSGVIFPYTSNFYLNIPYVSNMNPGAITVCAWVKVNNFHSSSLDYLTVFCADNAPTAYHSLFIRAVDSKLAIYTEQSLYDGMGIYTVPSGTWCHVGYTYDSTHGLVGYINGSPDASGAAVSPLVDTTVDSTIGIDLATPTRLFDGVIDEVKIFNRAISLAEMLAIYNL